MFISVCVVLSMGRRLVSWTIAQLKGEDRTFEALYNEIKAGKYDCIKVCDGLIQVCLLKTLVGADDKI